MPGSSTRMPFAPQGVKGLDDISSTLTCLEIVYFIFYIIMLERV